MKMSSKRILSLLLVLAMLLSMLTAAVSAASLNLTEIAANEDENLGKTYPVQDVISLAESRHHTLKIAVENMTAEALAASIEAGEIKLSLDRDASRPYVDSTLFPKASAGGDMTVTSIWKTNNNRALFTNFAMAASEEEGKTILTVDFDNASYWTDNSAPHANGGSYLDTCGWFKLTVSAAGAAIGTTDLKVAPYDNFHTMPEIYTEIGEIVELANKNGLYASQEFLGKSSAGRDIPYMIIADSEATVNAWLSFTDYAEQQPTKALADIAAGKYNDIRVPILYSNIHSNEVAAVDGIMNFAWMLAKEGIDGTFNYNMLTGFTEEGQAQLESELYSRRIAIPDLVKDVSTYLGFLRAGNSASGKVDLDKYYERKDNEISIRDLLSGVFYILVPEENVDGRTYITRTSSNGYDLNRDNSFQTTSETSAMQYMIGTYNPVSFTEFHGRVTAFQCEPCDPPHEPNFEYDLLAEHLMTGGEAFAIAAVANNDAYNSYVIPQRDYLLYNSARTQATWDAWDDMSTSYTPQFAMLHGTVSYTVELPAYNDHTAQAVCYGMVGQSDYIKAEKLGYLKAQVGIYERGATNANSDAFELVGQWFCDQNDVEGAEMELFRPEYTGEDENGNFYPECYIIPLDSENQRNLASAADMMVWLTRNDAKVNVTTEAITIDGVTYPAGTMIVSMYQAKRSIANSALYDGTLIHTWSTLYSEGITSFNETRGFDMVTITKPAVYAEIAAVCGEAMDYAAAVAYAESLSTKLEGATLADVIIRNDSEVAVSAVNALLQAGKTVAMITEGDNKGNFICDYYDFLTIADEYLLTATGVYGADIVAKPIKKAPVVYITGVPNASTSGCIATSQVGNANWNYDRIAMQLMNFPITENVAEADVIAGASSLSGAALTAAQRGTPYIGYGSSANRTLASSTTRTSLSGSMDCLAYVTYPNETLVNCTNIAENDDVMYGYGVGYYSVVPNDAVVLVQVDGTREPTEGFIPTNSTSRLNAYNNFHNGGILGYSYDNGTVHYALFANSLTHKVHQRDEYSYISNFIFSSMLDEENDYAGTSELGAAVRAAEAAQSKAETAQAAAETAQKAAEDAQATTATDKAAAEAAQAAAEAAQTAAEKAQAAADAAKAAAADENAAAAIAAADAAKEASDAATAAASAAQAQSAAQAAQSKAETAQAAAETAQKAAEDAQATTATDKAAAEAAKAAAETAKTAAEKAQAAAEAAKAAAASENTAAATAAANAAKDASDAATAAATAAQAQSAAQAAQSKAETAKTAAEAAQKAAETAQATTATDKAAAEAAKTAADAAKTAAETAQAAAEAAKAAAAKENTAAAASAAEAAKVASDAAASAASAAKVASDAAASAAQAAQAQAAAQAAQAKAEEAQKAAAADKAAAEAAQAKAEEAQKAAAADKAAAEAAQAAAEAAQAAAETAKAEAERVKEAVEKTIEDFNKVLNDPTKDYIDMPAEDNWAYAGIRFCIENNYMGSTSGTELVFTPSGTLTRAELVTILYRMAGEPKISGVYPFQDAAPGWAKKAILWAEQNGIVKGVGDGTQFDPNGKVNREQIATFLYRYCGSPKVTGDLSEYPDAGNVSKYSKTAMIWATQNKIVTGKKVGNASNLAPLDNATRAEIAAIITRYADLKK